MTDWIKNLKAGDKVIHVYSRGSQRRIVKIKRVTKTLIVLEGDSRFRLKTGDSMGTGPWDTTDIKEATPEAIKEVNEQVLRSNISYRLAYVKWENLEIDRLIAISDLVFGDK